MANFEYSEEKKRKDAALAQHNATKPGAFSFSGAADKDNIENQIKNYKKFSYDINADALYQQYKDQYIQQGKLASMDTMGQAAAMTGGYGNSYAQNVGQQAYQGYLQQLNNKVPELYQLALNQYTQDKQDLYNQYALHQDKEKKEYTEYLNNFNNWLSEREYLANDVANTAQTEYNQWLDSKEMEENEKANLINLITSTGYKPSDAELDAAGMTESQAAGYANAYKASQNTNANTKDPEYTVLNYDEQKKWEKNFEGATSLSAVEREADKMEAAGVDPAIVAQWRDYYAQKFIPDAPIATRINASAGSVGGTYYARQW